MTCSRVFRSLVVIVKYCWKIARGCKRGERGLTVFFLPVFSSQSRLLFFFAQIVNTFVINTINTLSHFKFFDEKNTRFVKSIFGVIFGHLQLLTCRESIFHYFIFCFM